MVFNATFNNISVISWRSALLVEETGETTDLPQVSDKLYHIMCIEYTSPGIPLPYLLRSEFTFVKCITWFFFGNLVHLHIPKWISDLQFSHLVIRVCRHNHCIHLKFRSFYFYTGRIMWLGMEGGGWASTQVSAQ
jgi:hypothetical protein